MEDIVLGIVVMVILTLLFVRYDNKVKKGERSWEDIWI